jgi:hypothetical protein
VQLNERGLTRRLFFDADDNPLQIVVYDELDRPIKSVGPDERNRRRY